MVASVKEEIKSGFTKRAIVVSVVLTILGFVVNTLTWWGNGISLEPFYAGRVGSGIYPPYGLVFLLMLASAWLGAQGFSLQEIAVITTVTFVAADSPFVVGAFLQFIFAGTYLAQSNPNVKALLGFYPSFWTPGLDKLNIITSAWQGGATVPVGTILPYLTFWIFMAILYMVLMLFQASIIQKQLVKKEKLPFPTIIPINELSNSVRKGTFTTLIKNWWFLGSLLVGSLVGLIASLNYILKFTTIFFAYGQFYMTPLANFLTSISQRTVGGWWMLIPADVAIFFLAPLDILYSIVIYVFLLQIVYPLVLLSIGAITPGTYPDWSGPFPWVPFSVYWVPLALGVWTLVMGYNTYKESLSKALSRTSEAGEYSDFLLWGGFAVTILVWLVIWTAFGAKPLLLVLSLVVWLVYTLGMTAVHGYTGTWVSVYGAGTTRMVTWASGSYLGVYHIDGTAANTKTAWANMAAVAITSDMGGVIQQNTHQTWAYTSTYALADSAKCKEKDIFNSQLLGILLTALIAMPFGLWVAFGTGVGKLKAWGLGSGAAITGWQIPFVISNSTPPAGYHLYQAILAFILVGVLMFLRTKFAWFFFSPYAMFFYSGMWLLNAGIALVIKLIFLKVLGVKSYEEMGVPLAIGFLIGLTLFATIVMGLNAIISLFVASPISVGPTGA